jgi:hypothetical protein
MLEAILSSETPILTTVTRRNIPEDGILYDSLLYIFHKSVQDTHWVFSVSVVAW